MHTERIFFPTKGRLSRRVDSHRGAGWYFAGAVWSWFWGPLCQFLVFEQR